MTTYLLVDTFDDHHRPQIDSSARQRLLAEGISAAMLPTAAAFILLVAVFVLLALAQLRAGLNPKHDGSDPR